MEAGESTVLGLFTITMIVIRFQGFIQSCTVFQLFTEGTLYSCYYKLFIALYTKSLSCRLFKTVSLTKPKLTNQFYPSSKKQFCFCIC